MRTLLLLFCIAITQDLWSQSYEKTFQEDLDRIREGEKRSLKTWNAAQQNSSAYSVASDNVDLHYIQCNWEINPGIRYIKGSITYHFTATENTSSIVFDLSKPLIADSVLYHGTKILAEQNDADGLVIHLPSALGKGSKDSLTIHYQGVPQSNGFGSFYQGAHAGIPVIWTLSEPFGAKEWWPCKNKLADKIDSLDILISCPKIYQPSANGVMISNTLSGDKRVTAFRHRYPIATYLVALAVTNYVVSDNKIAIAQDSILLQNFAYPESAGVFNGFTEFHINAFEAFTKWFEPYPFRKEKYGHTQWDWNGGMEHQTNTFVNMPAPAISAHELAHQWFGDLVTCGSWRDIWLNEGFATYGTLLFNEYAYPSFFRSGLRSALNNITSLPDGSVIVPDTTSENRIFSGRLSYNKGAYVLHMLRWVLGDSLFAKGVRNYLKDPALRGGFAVTADLQRHLESASGKDLTAFFKKWIYGEGYPNYEAEWSQNSNNWVKVKLKQSTTHPSVTFYEMPVPILLKGPSGTLNAILDHKESGQEFWINAGFPIDSVFIDPDLWILSKSKFTYRISTTTEKNQVKLYPNPSREKLTIQLKNPTGKQLRIRVYSSTGQFIREVTAETPGRDESIPFPAVALLAKGQYWIMVENESGFRSIRKWIRY
jgi:aminopeptidase N